MLLDVFEGTLAGEVEHHEDSVTTLEVGRDDRSVLFLTGSIPDVQFCWFVFQQDVFHFEVDCCYLGIFFGQEVALGEPPEKGSLSDIAVPDDDDLVLLLVLVH